MRYDLSCLGALLWTAGLAGYVPGALAQDRSGGENIVEVVRRQQILIEQQGERLREQERALDELRQQVARLSGASHDPAVATRSMPSAQQVPGTDAAMASLASAGPDDGVKVVLGGWVQVDMLYFPDARPGETEDLLYPTIFSTDPAAHSRGRFRASARDTRLNVDVRTNSPIGPLRAFAEFDFFGSIVANAQSQFNAYDPRLRHAFIEWTSRSGDLSIMAGQNWSLFADPASYAAIYNPLPLGAVFVRQPQLRLVYKVKSGLSLAVSIENPNGDVGGASGAGPGEQFDSLPDFVISARLERRWGALQLGGLLRSIEETEPNGRMFGWGVSGSGVIRLPIAGQDQKLRFQATYGTGVGRYIGELGPGSDGFVGAHEELLTNRVFAGNLSYEHSFADWLSGTLQGSHVRVSSPEGLPGDRIETINALVGNIVLHPISTLDLAFEYMEATRGNVDGTEASGSLLRFSTRYRF